MHKTLIGLFCATALFSTTLLASGESHFTAGDFTLTLIGGGSSDNDFDSSTSYIQLGLGHYITDQFAVNLRQDLGFIDIGDSNFYNASTRVGGQYVWAVNQFAPYFGANIGVVYGDVLKNQFIAGPNLGTKFFVNETTFINLGIEYQFLFRNTSGAQDGFKDGRFVYELGMGVRW